MTNTNPKMNRRTFATALIALGAMTATNLMVTPVDAAVWAQLGSRKVNGLVDFDKIHVSPGLGKFSKIRLKVRGNSLMVYDVKVHFRNGAVQDVPIRLFIPQGGQTRLIDLNGTDRRIQKVTFTYGKFPNGNGRTSVDLIAKK